MFFWYDSFGYGRYEISGPWTWAAAGFQWEKYPSACNFMVPHEGWDCN